MGAHPTLLFTGASGLVGASLYRAAFALDQGASSKWRVVLAVHRRSAPSPLRRGDRIVKCDLSRPGEAGRLVAAVEPQAVLHAAALASLSECEALPALAQRMNGAATAELARTAADAGVHFVHLSTDQVFDGDQTFDGERGAYREEDEPRPRTVYGASKLAGERAVLQGGEALVLRAALVLAPSASGRSGALDLVRGAGQDGAPAEVPLFVDEWRTPLSVLDLARVVVEALKRRATGILHVAGPDRVNRLELGLRIAAAFPPPVGSPPPRLLAAEQRAAGHVRPRDVSLAVERITREGWPRPAGLEPALAELRAWIDATR